MEAKPTRYAMIMEAKPTQYAMIMEAKPIEVCDMEATPQHPDKFRRHTTTCDGLPSRIKDMVTEVTKMPVRLLTDAGTTR
jgi:hypothetical protein